MRLLALVVLAGCDAGSLATTEAAPPGPGLAPPPSLSLTHDRLLSGESATVYVSGANSGEEVYLLLSSSGAGAGPCPAVLGGECLDILGPFLGGVDTADGNGDAEIVLTMPDPIPVATVWLQAATTSAAVSNVAEAEADAAPEVCYPGPSEDWTACVELVDHDPGWGADYDYPAPYLGSPQYEEPVRYVDLAVANPSLSIAPNFVLSELMQEWKGRYGVYQPHVVDNLQYIRDETGGALNVNSGYRNPAYNASVGGATYSRHMYGDAADVWSSVASLTTVGDHCDDLGAGYIGYYAAHVHCDWRDDPLEPILFDPDARDAFGEVLEQPERVFAAELVRGAVWTAPATGWDEGEPLREWTAYDADGVVIDTYVGGEYLPPVEAVEIEVVVGRELLLSARP